jgi:hypothetical protein
MHAAYWYQLNNTGDKTTAKTGLQQLVDGNTEQGVFMGWGKLLPAYDAYYEFKDLTKVSITKIKFYDGQSSCMGRPFSLYTKSSASAPATLLATYTGDGSGRWL